MNDLILYTTEDGRSQIKLRAQEQTVWLTQLEIAERFDATKQTISLHLKSVFDDGELVSDSVVTESLTTATDGKNDRCQPRAATVKDCSTVQLLVGKCDRFAHNTRVKRRATHNIATCATKDTPWS